MHELQVPGGPGNPDRMLLCRGKGKPPSLDRHPWFFKEKDKPDDGFTK